MSDDLFSKAVDLSKQAPAGRGRVEYLINRPSEGVHDLVKELYFDSEKGIIGDRWSKTAWLQLADGAPDPRLQVSMTNFDVMSTFASRADKAVFACGDNLYTDLNLTHETLPTGSRLQIGEAVLEVSDVVNDGCGKFSQRFGKDAFHFVRDPQNLPYRLRGLFGRIVQSGSVRVGDVISVLED
ncbi:MAG: MOSC domain-containing protein [Opitutaceae bacterium]